MPSYQHMVLQAIVETKDRNGTSGVAIRNHIKANHDVKSEDAFFNAHVRKVIKGLVDDGLVEGTTVQHFKITTKGKSAAKDAEGTPKKAKKTTKKKDTKKASKKAAP